MLRDTNSPHNNMHGYICANGRNIRVGQDEHIERKDGSVVHDKDVAVEYFHI